VASEFVWTGNEVDVYLDGIQAEALQTITGSDDYGHQPVSGVGNIHVMEYVPERAMHQVTIDRMAMRKDQLVKAGIVQENGDSAMRGKVFDVEIFHKEGALMKKYVKAVCSSARMTVTAHRVTISDAVFLARDTVGTLSLA